MQMQMVRRFAVVLSVISFALVSACGTENGPLKAMNSTVTPKFTMTPFSSLSEPTPNPGEPNLPSSTVVVLVDDFEAQPLRGDQVWFYNRLDSDRGQIGDSASDTLHWEDGYVKAELTSENNSRVGSWNALNHLLREGIPLNFNAIFDSAILPKYQGKVTGVRFQVRDGNGLFYAALESPDSNVPWREEVRLSGGRQTLDFDLPPDLSEIKSLNWLIEGVRGDFVVLDRIELLVDLPNISPAERAFLYNYTMLLSNFDWDSGLTRDRHRWESGDFDNVSASGLQAASAVVAEHLGFISRQSATEIVTRTTSVLLGLPKCNGLWPHFVREGDIVARTEFSSIDSIIAIYSVLESRQALGLETAEIERVLKDINWTALMLPNGSVSHGFDTGCDKRLTHGWDVFGSESWLVNLGYATATGEMANLKTGSRTFNGAGFITEIAWLFVPSPDKDSYGVKWTEFRRQDLERQLAYYAGKNECYSRHGLFGLSAAEVPSPDSVSPSEIYQAFGIGGDISPNDGTEVLGRGVVIPNYAALIASLGPGAAITMSEELIHEGLFTPLNNVESLMFVDEPTCQATDWNSLKGSLNLGFATLGWGRFLSGDAYPLYEALWANDALKKGYQVLCVGCSEKSLVSGDNATPIGLLSLEAEDGSGSGSTMPRAEVSMQQTVLLTSNQFAEITFSLPAAAPYEISARYLNDGGADIVQILLDGIAVGQFTSVNTRPTWGEPGSGFNSFANSGVVSVSELLSGTHQLNVLVLSGDPYGVEIDQMTLTKTN